MITCATCGRMIPDNAASCPNCGAITELGRATRSQSSEYQPQQQNYTPPDYNSGYVPPQQQSQPQPQQQFGYNQQPGYTPPQQQQQQQFGYNQQAEYAPPQQQGYAQPPNYGPYQQQQGGVNVTVMNNAAPGHSNTPVIVEILLNIFLGIYGVGWLMAGETVPGVILLVCTFVNWFIVGILWVFTLGIGMFCWGPLLIAAIIVNAILLNNTLKRKSSQVVMVQQRY